MTSVSAGSLISTFMDASFFRGSSCGKCKRQILSESNKMTNRTDIKDLNKIPNVGPATTKRLNMLGIKEPFELIGQNPYSMFEELCEMAGRRFDPCLADVFISAVRFMEGAPPKKWWEYTKERKAAMSKNGRAYDGVG